MLTNERRSADKRAINQGNKIRGIHLPAILLGTLLAITIAVSPYARYYALTLTVDVLGHSQVDSGHVKKAGAWWKANTAKPDSKVPEVTSKALV